MLLAIRCRALNSATPSSVHGDIECRPNATAAAIDGKVTSRASSPGLGGGGVARRTAVSVMLYEVPSAVYHRAASLTGPAEGWS